MNRLTEAQYNLLIEWYDDKVFFEGLLSEAAQGWIKELMDDWYNAFGQSVHYTDSQKSQLRMVRQQWIMRKQKIGS